MSGNNTETKVYDTERDSWLTGAPADAVIDAHDKGKTSCVAMDGRGRGVMLEIQGSKTEYGVRIIDVIVVRSVG